MDRDERLRQFFGVHFNQDSFLDAASREEILDRLIARNPTARVQATIGDLRAWLSDTQPGDSLPAKFGCDLMTDDDWAWVEAMANYLDTKTAARS